MKSLDKKIIFLGTEFTRGQGGIASVLREYRKIFPTVKFISTTASEGGLSNLLSLFHALLILPYYLVKKTTSIVHIHGASFNSFYRKFLFIKICQFFGGKVIYHVHGGQFQTFYSTANKLTRYLISDAVNNVDCIICLSENWRNFFLSNFEPKKIEVIPNIVPYREFSSRSKTLKSFPLKFVFLGDISKQKGVWWLMEACAENKLRWTGKIKIYLAGKGDTSLLVNDIKAKGLEKIMEYVGWISGDGKDQMLETSDVFILPSYNEGLPISILEAMSYGLPVISTNVGGIPEIVEQHKNGILVKPENSRQLIAAIDFAIENSNEFIAYGTQSLERVKPYFPEQVKEKLILIYKELLQ